MYIELSDLLWLTLICGAMLYWWQAQRIKELALREARKQCKELDLQLLDESVALRAFWFKRGEDGKVHIWRSYTFNFSSTGDDRYTGRIVLLGRAITGIHLEPHRI
ncbi:DUF3301 domain-containing protein [Marinobacterium arenosum]|uniref:DUF3301 domain-containing protein n=1 Tax=Marinobacterium arenosum TaxID=2862496 RepID=UPI001C972412|nr:DUF3301 domain-containing protein [Marinobacterium arenosum]MBY4678210.1 DUF3301 domain-containing protein [Marinobacterium arenosum]